MFAGPLLSFQKGGIEMLEVMIYICVFFIGFLSAYIVFASRSVGKIQIDETNEDGPYFLLHIYNQKSLDKLIHQKLIMLDVEKKSFNSRN